MKDQYNLFEPTTCGDTHSATSSPASQSGPTPCASPDGQTTGQSGQGVAPAKDSRQRARAKGLTTLATSGLIGCDSSASAALQSSLESNLTKLLDSDGSILYSMKWKQKVTPLGRRYIQLAARARLTSGNDSISVLQGWPTPNTPSGGPNTRSTEGGYGALSADVALTGWATPRSVSAGHSTGNPERAQDGKSRLEDQVFLAQLTASGPGPIGYLLGPNGWETHPASGQLNAAHSRFLMGLPPIWDECAIRAFHSLKARKRASSGSKATATRSTPAKLRRSSKHS